jgi:murein DD-endopeptidase MepM/ murein hydrolase activator NlpD
MKLFMIYVFILFAGCCACFQAPSTAPADVTPLENLNDYDASFTALRASTTASKNRMLKKERRPLYSSPVLYRYVLKAREDIWTIIAKTSLNIESITTLNRLDFIGMVGEGRTVYLPDTLGVFVDTDGHSREELSERFSVEIEAIQLVDDPVEDGGNLFFVPEATVPFFERSYLLGVVFHAPLMGVKTSGYGTRIDPFVNEETFHGGVDIAAKEGTAVRASRGGKVIFARAFNGYGNLVILMHDFGYHTLYGHMAEMSVEEGVLVETGQILGKVGATGRTTGPHLHFEIRRYEKPLDPESIPFFLTPPVSHGAFDPDAAAGSACPSELDALLTAHAAVHRVPHLPHFGDQISGFDEGRWSAPSRDDDVHRRGPRCERADDLSLVDHAEAHEIGELIENHDIES